MTLVLPGASRGATQIEWLDSRHSFSFGEYQDGSRMGFRSLRVLNDDHIAPGMGFGMHGHREMEIISIVLAGQMQHRDSLGNGTLIVPGEVQIMHAGTGIRHSEFNASETEPLHLLQIWLFPERDGLEPGYDQKTVDLERGKSDWLRLVSPSGGPDEVQIFQDASLWWTEAAEDRSVAFQASPDRHLYVHVINGEVQVGEQTLISGDALALSGESFEGDAKSGTRILLFDLA